jgi:hypothetical protein
MLEGEPGITPNSGARLRAVGAAFQRCQDDSFAGLHALYPPERVVEAVESGVFSALDAPMLDNR